LVAFYGYGDLTGDWAVQPSINHNNNETISMEAADKALNRVPRHCVPTGSQLKGRFEYYVYSRQQGIWPSEISGHDPIHESDWYQPYEPVNNVTADFPPTIFLHGQADSDVPITVAERMVDELERSGVPVNIITGATWNHVFDQEEAESPSVEAALKEVIMFLDAHMK
jgi:acetyl esterase/lipase